MKLTYLDSHYAEESVQIDSFRQYMEEIAKYWSEKGYAVNLIVGADEDNLIENLIRYGYKDLDAILEDNFTLAKRDSIDTYEVFDYNETVAGYYAKITV